MEIQLSFFDTDLTDDQIRLRDILKRGSGYEGGPLRIYAAEQLLDAERFVMFLADEFHVGGHSYSKDGFSGFVDYNGRGLTVREWKTSREWNYTWRQVARVYTEMIRDGEFPELDVVCMYQEARKANKGAPMPRMHYWGGDED